MGFDAIAHLDRRPALGGDLCRRIRPMIVRDDWSSAADILTLIDVEVISWKGFLTRPIRLGL